MDDKPGAPQEPEQPKSVSKKISFSYLDLIFDSVFISENRRFIRFYVEQEEPFYIEMLQVEYLQYQYEYFNQRSSCDEETSCTCDEVCPPYELLGEETVIIKAENTNTKEITEHEITYHVYYVYDLINVFKFGIHQSHEDYNFNLN